MNNKDYNGKDFNRLDKVDKDADFFGLFFLLVKAFIILYVLSWVLNKVVYYYLVFYHNFIEPIVSFFKHLF
ncbi:hypothetical protein [Acinetobacter sp. MB5]|uniref:hypothetical protein n=1 Tax=Acinetobacter sp. MB5 TaxID=2069438 RepID=UPI000DCFB8E2|nr:hypothetical protein [Acinetobacter sp. MB5]